VGHILLDHETHELVNQGNNCSVGGRHLMDGYTYNRRHDRKKQERRNQEEKIVKEWEEKVY
jgi:hypothetical protein